MSEKLWGIDLGGTKIEGIVLNSKDNPEVLVRKRIDTEAKGGFSSRLGAYQVANRSNSRRSWRAAY